MDPPVRVVPVEYKRGRPKAHQADEVQLCAQALCLEEMFHLQIEQGFLFYGSIQRRVEILFDETLRNTTLRISLEIRSCIDAGRTPPADYESGKCDRCSLIEVCQPLANRFKRGAASWFVRHLDGDSIHA
jgi:CRISPR-associated exonuclease Cas4